MLVGGVYRRRCGVFPVGQEVPLHGISPLVDTENQVKALLAVLASLCHVRVRNRSKDVFLVLLTRGPLPPGEIGTALNMGAGGVRRALLELERRGMARREQAHDHRRGRCIAEMDCSRWRRRPEVQEREPKGGGVAAEKASLDLDIKDGGKSALVAEWRQAFDRSPTPETAKLILASAKARRVPADELAFLWAARKAKGWPAGRDACQAVSIEDGGSGAAGVEFASAAV